jgi:hypothetical protein
VADKGVRFPALFDEEWWAVDLDRAGRSGRRAAEAARTEYDRLGVPREELRPCEDEARDGTDLGRCFKVYLPPPIGRFGMVFFPEVVKKKIVLRYLAFGVRHHPKGSHAETVYEIAHGRLNG